MIAKVTSKKEVVIDTFDNTSATPVCELITFTKVNNSYSANGSYYYVVSDENDVETKIPIRSFSKTFSDAEVDGLFNSLGLTYPEGASYSERDVINMQAGLMAIVVAESRWGLTASDWE